MSRPLVPGLVAEGDTDEHFLGRVISRRLRALTDMSPRPVGVQGIQYGACRMTKDDKGIDRPVIPLVPVKETESWLLADARVWGRVSRGRHASRARQAARRREVRDSSDRLIDSLKCDDLN